MQRQHTFPKLCAAALLLASPLPQAGFFQEAQKERPAIRRTTRLVLVPVVAVGRDGKPIADLREEEFQVFEGGKRQSVQLFSLERRNAANPAVPTSADALPTTPAKENSASRLPGVTNRGPEAAHKNVTAVLLDALNTRTTDQAFGREQVRGLFKKLEGEERVGLYALGAELRVLQDYTTDSAALEKAVSDYKGGIPVNLNASTPRRPDSPSDRFDDMLRDLNARIAAFHTTARVQATARAIESIANHLAKFPGRKSLVWVSGGFPFSLNTRIIPNPLNSSIERPLYDEEVRRVARALNHANVAIYPVDVRGLIDPTGGDPDFNRSMRLRPGTGEIRDPSLAAAQGQSGVVDLSRSTQQTAYGAVQTGEVNLGQIAPQMEVMKSLADDTGGIAFVNTNDIFGAVRRALDDSRVTYVLGYYPTHKQWDGKFHTLEVKIARPDVQLRHRRGYYAFPDQPLDMKQRELMLQDIAGSPLEATGIGLGVSCTTDGSKVTLAIQIDATNLRVRQEGERWLGSFDLFFGQIDAEGKLLQGAAEEAAIDVPQEAFERFLRQGVRLERRRTPLPAATRLRVVVLEPSTGLPGSVTIPLPCGSASQS